MPKRRKLESIRQSSLFEMDTVETTTNLIGKLEVERPFFEPGLLLGTSSFTATGWQGMFYPEGTKSSDYLKYYASKFKTVEIDSTYYLNPA
jgi:hypothetical protein